MDSLGDRPRVEGNLVERITLMRIMGIHPVGRTNLLMKGAEYLDEKVVWDQRDQRGLQLLLMRGEKGQISAELCYQRVQRSLQL